MGYTPPPLEVRKVTGGWSIYPPNTTTTDDIWLYSNLTDTYPFLQLLGNAGITSAVNTNYKFRIDDRTMGEMFSVSHVTPDVQVLVANNKNLLLNVQGTGLVKFGAYTAGAATDSTGYITILDAAGNTRKLMVQA